MGYEAQKKNKPFKNYGRYFLAEEKNNDYDLQGCYKAPEDARVYEIKGDSLYSSSSYDVVFEDYYVPINITDQNLCEYGKIYQSGDRIIKLTDKSYVLCEKTCRYLGVIERDSNKYLHFQFLPNTIIKLTMGKKFDFSLFKFYYREYYYKDDIELSLISYEYIGKRQYQITLTPIILEESIVANDIFSIYVYRQSMNGDFFIPKTTVFMDENNQSYVKRYFHNATYGYLYQNVNVEIISELGESYLVSGLYKGTKLLYDSSDDL